ncbi:MAG: hypothetical protein Q9198_000291 [Flavoplaca austrocitrina]
MVTKVTTYLQGKNGETTGQGERFWEEDQMSRGRWKRRRRRRPDLSHLADEETINAALPAATREKDSGSASTPLRGRLARSYRRNKGLVRIEATHATDLETASSSDQPPDDTTVYHCSSRQATPCISLTLAGATNVTSRDMADFDILDQYDRTVGHVHLAKTAISTMGRTDDSNGDIYLKCNTFQLVGHNKLHPSSIYWDKFRNYSNQQAFASNPHNMYYKPCNSNGTDDDKPCFRSRTRSYSEESPNPFPHGPIGRQKCVAPDEFLPTGGPNALLLDEQIMQDSYVFRIVRRPFESYAWVRDKTSIDCLQNKDEKVLTTGPTDALSEGSIRIESPISSYSLATKSPELDMSTSATSDERLTHTVRIKRRYEKAHTEATISYYPDILPYFALHNIDVLRQQITKVGISFVRKLHVCPLDPLVRGCQPRDTPSYKPSFLSSFLQIPYCQHIDHRWGGLLHWSCRFDYEDAVKFLLTLGFDINEQVTEPVTNYPQWSPLYITLRYGNTRLVDFLLSRGAIAIPGIENPPMIFWLSRFDEHEVLGLALVPKLIKAGFDVNAKASMPTLQHCFRNHRLWSWRRQASFRGRIDDGAKRSSSPSTFRQMEFLARGARFPVQEKLFKVPSPRTNVVRTYHDSLKVCQGPFLFLDAPCPDPSFISFFLYKYQTYGNLPPAWTETPLGLLVTGLNSQEGRDWLGTAYGSPQYLAAVDMLRSFQAHADPNTHLRLLHSTVRFGHVDILEHLLRPRDVDSTVDGQLKIEDRWKGLTPLHTAILYGRQDCFDWLLANNADPLAKTSRHRFGALHLLFWRTHSEALTFHMLKSLLKHGVPVHETYPGTDARYDYVISALGEGVQPVHLAVLRSTISVVQYLLKRGADPDAVLEVEVNSQLSEDPENDSQYEPGPQHSIKGCTVPGIFLVRNELFALSQIEALLQSLLAGSKSRPIHEPCYTRPKTKTTLLHSLAGTSRLSHLTWRIFAIIPRSQRLSIKNPRKRVDDINIRDNDGDTPLHYAAASDSVTTIQILRASGADATVSNRFGMTPKDIAIWRVFLIPIRNVTVSDPKRSRRYSDSRQGKPLICYACDDEGANRLDELIAERGTESLIAACEHQVTDRTRLERLAVTWGDTRALKMLWLEKTGETPQASDTSDNSDTNDNSDQEKTFSLLVETHQARESIRQRVQNAVISLRL